MDQSISVNYTNPRSQSDNPKYIHQRPKTTRKQQLNMNSLVDKFYNKTKSQNTNVFVKSSGSSLRDKILGKYGFPTETLATTASDSASIAKSSSRASIATAEEPRHLEDDAYHDTISNASSNGSMHARHTSSDNNYNLSKLAENKDEPANSPPKNLKSFHADADEMTVLLQILQKVYQDIVSLQQMTAYNSSSTEENEIYNISESPELTGISPEINKKKDINSTRGLSNEDSKNSEFIDPDDSKKLIIQKNDSSSLLDFQKDYDLKNYTENSSRGEINLIAPDKNEKKRSFSNDMNMLEEKDKQKEKFETYLRSSMLCFFDQIDKFSIIQNKSNDKIDPVETRWKKTPTYPNNGTGSGQLFDRDFSTFKESRKKTQQSTTEKPTLVNDNTSSGFSDSRNLSNVPLNYCSLPELYRLSDTNDKILKANELQFLKFKKLLLNNNESTLSILKNFLVVTIKLLNLKVGAIINYNPVETNNNRKTNDDESDDEDEDDEFNIEDCLRDVSKLEKTLNELKLEIEKNSDLLMKAANEKEQSK